MLRPALSRVFRPSVLALALIAILAAWLRFDNLGREPLGLPIYAATAKNTLLSLHHWIYPSLQPDGSVLADKPPLFFWLMAISVAFLGPTNFALRLPAAVAGVLAVPIVYLVVRRRFGSLAGLTSAFILAVLPENVNFARGTFMESTAGLLMLLTTLYLFKGVEEKRSGYIYLAAVVLALNFQVKLWHALLPLPAYAVYYLLERKIGWGATARTLAIAAAIFLVLAFAWPVVMWLTASQYERFMNADGIWDLIFRYNLFGRFEEGAYNAATFNASFPWLLRSPTSQLFGPGVAVALVGLLAATVEVARRKNGQAAMWLVWLFAGGIAFTAAVTKLSQYMDALSPAIAALGGIGLAHLVRGARNGRLLWGLAALAAAGLVYDAGVFWDIAPKTGLRPVEAAFLGAFLTPVVFLAGWLVSRWPGLWPKRAAVPLFMVPFAFLLAMPLNMTLGNVLKTDNVGLRAIGFDTWLPPATSTTTPTRAQANPGLVGAFVSTPGWNAERMVAFLKTHRGDAEYLVAAESYNTSAAVIFRGGEKVLTLHGEYRDESLVQVEQLAKMAAEGRVKYFLVSPIFAVIDYRMYGWITRNSFDVSLQAGLPRMNNVRLYEYKVP